MNSTNQPVPSYGVPIFPLVLLGLFVLSFVAFTFTIGGGQVTGPSVFLALSVVALGVSVQLLIRSARALVVGGETDLDEEERAVGRRRKELEREYRALKRALKELELDHAMGKLSEVDYQDIRARYRERAVRIMRRLDEGQDYVKQIEQDLQARRAALGTAKAPPAKEEGPRQMACAGCGTHNDPDAAFCKKCGTKLAV